MPIQITGVEMLKEYILGVMARAEHHAQNVDEVCLAVAGAIVWRGERIEVLQRQGVTRNVLWMYIDDRKYAFSFNHNTGLIEVRQGNLQGPVMTTFSNATNHSEVKQFFSGL